MTTAAPQSSDPVRPKLVVIDDEDNLGGLICDIATHVGFDARPVSSGHEFKDLMNTEPVQVAISALVMADWDGLELVRFLAERDTPCGLVLMSQPDDRYLRVAATLASAVHVNLFGTLTKPVRASELVAVLSGALERLTPAPS